MYNFLIPQQNPLGRLQNRYSLANPIFYIEELNKCLYKLIQMTGNAYLIDVDQIASALGKRYIQDDSVYQLNHGSSISALPMPGDESRIEPLGDVEEIYSARVSNNSFAIYEEVLAAYRSIRQHDAIKLVIFDLDDTLWRGVAAERAESVDAFMTEGWPMGILEAGSFLWKRGILVAIVSKNDEHVVKTIWDKLHGHNFPLANFVATRINWKSKVENIADIVRLVNVRAEAVLFVDDNPIERAHVKSAFPDIRVIDAPVAEWRRILLWSAEMQPAIITQEAIGRAVSIKGKQEREAQQTSSDRETFLNELKLKINPFIVMSNDHPRLARCLELINKTNQFNTTGRRWTETEIYDLFKSNGRIFALQARDRFSNYGIIAVAVIQDHALLQYLMSCRVFGMEIEYAAVALVCQMLKELGYQEINGLTQPTGKNHLSLGLYSDLGFVSHSDGNWRRTLEPAIEVPTHVAVENAAQV